MITVRRVCGQYLELKGNFEEYDDLLRKDQVKEVIADLKDLLYDLEKFVKE